ncbi:MAG: peptidoglycan DD-metalloendopeptidase family protein [Novosphingobium sp.]
MHWGPALLKPRESAPCQRGGAAVVAAQGGPAANGLIRLWHDRDALLAQLETLDWTPDLADQIGSARWFRGLGTLVGLTLTALAFWPHSDAVAAAPTMSLDTGARDEFRSQMILPLALGGDSGRRMGSTEAVTPLAAAPERTSLQLTATLAQGDSFTRMLMRAGVSDADAGAATALIAGAVQVGLIPSGTQVDLRLGTPTSDGGRSLEHLGLRARFDLDLTLSRVNGSLAVTQHPIAVDTTPLRIRGVVGSGLYRSARAAGVPIEAIQQYLQTLDQHMSLDTAIEPGDTFDIIVSYRRSSNGEAEVGDLLFAGLEHDGRPKAQLLRWGQDGQFFEASGMGAQRTGLIMPVYGGRVTSNFGARRHPVLGYTRMHAGIDFGAPYGAAIYAVGDARVSYSGWHGGHGNYVKLDHGGGYATAYAHMSRIAVPSGTRVQAGQVIGYVGSTGLSTGPHLHYELYQNGRVVNPLSVRFTVSNQVDSKQLEAFKARMAQLKAVSPGAAMTSLGPRQATMTQTPRREIDRLKS